MQQFQTFAGIDISKLTLDICLLKGDNKEHFTISNDIQTIKAFFNQLPDFASGLYIGMENTGCYNYYLYQILSELELPFYVIPPIHLKKSLGLSRGKNDKIDAFRIASFLESNIKHLSIYKPQRTVILKLQLLLTARSQRVKIKKQLTNGGEQYQYAPTENIQGVLQLDSELVAIIDQQIKAIEIQIQELIKNDEKLSACYKLISSVQGVGKILSWNLLVRTGEFDNISSPRKLACFAGVAPFDHRSGTSIRGKSKVSHFADKSLKTLLHLAAISAIRLAGDLRDYYLRKVAEGKNKMSVINAIRNKIIHRVYAVLKNQKTYQNYLVMS